MLVRRSKSSAILPLRKHLIEKTLMEQKAMDEEQFYFQQKQKVSIFLMVARFHHLVFYYYIEKVH